MTSGSMNTRLGKVLFSYCITPQGTTGVSPAELLLGRRPHTRLDLLRPNTAGRVEERQQQQKQQHDSRMRLKGESARVQGGRDSFGKELWQRLSMATREDHGGIRSSIISSASGRWETETVSSGPDSSKAGRERDF